MDKDVKISSKKNKNGTQSLFLQYCKEGVFIKSTGITVLFNKNQIDFFKKRRKIPSSISNYLVLNEKLNELKTELEENIDHFYVKFKKYPTKNELESYLTFGQPINPIKTDNFIDCLAAFIKEKSESKNVKQYQTLFNHLCRFKVLKYSNRDILFMDLQVLFFKEFFIFLSNKGNTIIKGKSQSQKGLCDNGLIKLAYELSSAINGINKYEIARIQVLDIQNSIHVALEKLHVMRYDNKGVVISHDEAVKLFEFKLKDDVILGKNGKIIKNIKALTLERYKNLFLLQATKGCRHSDLYKISMGNLNGSTISMMQKKTKRQVEVRIDSQTIELMEHSKSEQEVSNQNYNGYIKIIFKQFFEYYKANYKADDQTYKLDNIPVIKFYLGVEKKKLKKRYELIASHTARRSFVSIAKIVHNMPDIEIMHQTGHTNPNSLRPYMVYYEEIERPKVIDFSKKPTPIIGDKKQFIDYDKL